MLSPVRTTTLILIGLLATSSPVAAAEFFLSPAGDDANPGTQAKPFRSFEKARDAARAYRAAHPQAAGDLTIWLAAGDYPRTQSLLLSEADSGTPQSRLVWRALPGEKARVLGARRLGEFSPVTDQAVLARLPETARPHVLQTSVEKDSIPDFGGQQSRGFGRPTTPSHCELFYQGQPMTLARWPNEGTWEHIAGFPETGAQPDDHGGKIGKLDQGFLYQGDRPRSWRDTGNLWVHGYWAWDWANSYERVASLDTASRLVKTAPPHGLYGFRKGQRYYFLNVLEELDSPGEWFLDRESGQVYFWPPDDALKVNRAEVLLSVLQEPFFSMRESSHLTLRSLVLEGTRATAVEIQGGASNLVAGCTIRNIGNYGVTIRGGRAHGVAGCDILDTGDGGVSMDGGDRQTLVPGGHYVDNCHFQRQGRWSKCYVPAVLMGGVGLRATHNLIHDHPHCAILFTGNDHVIEYNEIHHIALETGDVGAIYTGRDYSYRGNRIRHNYIHHTGGVGMGSMGAYMDDCVSGTEIYGNIFYKVQRAAFLGGGRDHPVVNNIFVECNHAVELDGRGLDRSPVWRGMVDRTMRQRLQDVPLTLYRERYPEMKSLDAHYGPPGGPAIEGDAFKGVPPEGNVVADNICVGKWLNVYWNAKQEMLELRNNFTEGDPGLVGEPNDHAPATAFRLKPDAPALKSGFRQLPVEQIGLYPSELRPRGH